MTLSDNIHERAAQYAAELMRLERINADLLAALNEIQQRFCCPEEVFRNIADKAVEKAIGERL